MSRNSIVSIVSATLLAVGTACWLYADEPPRKWPKPTPPPPPSPIYHDVKEKVPTEAEITRDIEEHSARLEYEIDQALDGKDEQRRADVFVFLLPELLQQEPERVVAMVARREPGPARDRLRDEVTRQWVSLDQVAATRWIKSLEGEERRDSSKLAVATLKPIDPELAKALGRELLGDAEAPERLTSR
jgi:hypothetical protein